MVESSNKKSQKNHVVANQVVVNHINPDKEFLDSHALRYEAIQKEPVVVELRES